MRVTGGQYKNRKLVVPQGKDVRPTSDRMRQTLINLLNHAQWAQEFDFNGSHVLDLYCGSGALGIEALSNGAAHTHFVDLDTQSIKQNTHFLPENTYTIHKGNAASIRLSTAHAFDLVFMDPPYRKGLITPTLDTVVNHLPLSDQALIVIECEKELVFDVPQQVECINQRNQGQSTLHILRYNPTID